MVSKLLIVIRHRLHERNMIENNSSESESEVRAMTLQGLGGVQARNVRSAGISHHYGDPRQVPYRQIRLVSRMDT